MFLLGANAAAQAAWITARRRFFCEVTHATDQQQISVAAVLKGNEQVKAGLAALSSGIAQVKTGTEQTCTPAHLREHPVSSARCVGVNGLGKLGTFT
jgi:X-X-X-Leu-X-X-Gly heptad repeat protein